MRIERNTTGPDQTRDEGDSPRETGYPATNAGYYEHWSRAGKQLEAIRREELRRHGPAPYNWQLVDSLLQLGYLHRNPNRSTNLIAYQQRLAEAYARRTERT